MKKIRFVIADDQALILDGIKVILEAEEDFEVAAAAKDGAEALEKVSLCQPDIVILDIRMPNMDGVECTRRIKEKFPGIIILLLTTFDEQEYIVDAFKYGASGYLLKDITREQLIRTIRDALHGETILSSTVAAKLVKVASNQNSVNTDEYYGRQERNNGKQLKDYSKQEMDSRKQESFDFTDREVKVAAMLAKGFTNKQISTSLSFTEGTVKNTVSSIYSKIDIFDRTSAAIYLKEHGY